MARFKIDAPKGLSSNSGSTVMISMRMIRGFGFLKTTGSPKIVKYPGFPLPSGAFMAFSGGGIDMGFHGEAPFAGIPEVFQRVGKSTTPGPDPGLPENTRRSFLKIKGLKI